MYWYPLFEEDGSYFNVFGRGLATNNVTNPVAQANEIMRRSEDFRTLGSLATDIIILDGLRLNIMLGATNNSSRGWFFIPDMPGIREGITPEGGDNRTLSLNWLTETMLHYDRSFGNHNFAALAGYTTQKHNNSSNALTSRRFPNNMVHTLNVVGNNIHSGTSSESAWSLISYLARINYNYNLRYYITASIRADGSSRFGRENKFGFFPSVALMWRISEESFLRDVNAISNLNIRATYGATGNNDIGNFAHLATVTYPFHVIGGTGMAPSNLENTFLTWEKQNQFNFGIDASFFRNRINLTAEHFISRSHQLLLSVDVPQITGFSTALQNIGEVENRGWEFSLRTHNIRGVVNWHTNFNISTYRNKVLQLGPENAPIISGGTRPSHITQVGQPMGMFYGHKVDGIFLNQEELDRGPIWGTGAARSRVGDIRFVDISGPDGEPDGVIDGTHDRTIIGSPYPKFYLGMTNSVSYMNFTLSVSITSSYGNKVMHFDDYKLYTRARYKQYSVVRHHWRSEADPGNGREPRPNNQPTGGVRERSCRYLDDGSYLLVNNINLSYTFPSRITENLRVSDLRLYVTATNPFIFTNFKDMNPEVSHSTNSLTPGIMNYNYPTAKSLLFGINVTF